LQIVILQSVRDPEEVRINRATEDLNLTLEASLAQAA
jgi:hypothetical protein